MRNSPYNDKLDGLIREGSLTDKDAKKREAKRVIDLIENNSFDKAMSIAEKEFGKSRTKLMENPVTQGLITSYLADMKDMRDVLIASMMEIVLTGDFKDRVAAFNALKTIPALGLIHETNSKIETNVQVVNIQQEKKPIPKIEWADENKQLEAPKEIIDVKEEEIYEGESNARDREERLDDPDNLRGPDAGDPLQI